MSREGKAKGRPLHESLVRVAYGFAALAGLTGATLLAGWTFFGPAVLREWCGPIYMKTNAALGLLLAGAGLVLVTPAEVGRTRRWMGRICAAVALLLGALTFGEHLTGWDLGIDRLFASEPPGAVGVTSPNRMGPPASLSLALLGLALLLLSCRGSRTDQVAVRQALALVVILVAILPTIGYLYGAEELYEHARYTGIAWPTAVALLGLGIGVLCARPRDGLMAAVTAEDPGGGMIRSLLFPMILLPVILGWFRLVGERQGLYDAASGTATMMVIFIVVFSALTYHAGAGSPSRRQPCGKASDCTVPSVKPSTTAYGCVLPTEETSMPASRSSGWWGLRSSNAQTLAGATFSIRTMRSGPLRRGRSACGREERGTSNTATAAWTGDGIRFWLAACR